MDHKFIAAVSAQLQALTTLTGLPALWKDAAGQADPSLPLEQRRHCNAFCLKVKMSATRMRRCSRHDSIELAQRAPADGAPFLEPCHAGVEELIVPVLIDGVYRGAFLLGPFRRTEAVCPYPVCQEEFDRLPRYDATRIEAAARLLRLLRLNVSERQRNLDVRRLTEQKVSRLAAAFDFIDRHYAEPVTAAAAAKACSLSESRFLHRFKAESGLSFSVYLNRRRIEQARRLLAGSTLPLTEVAIRCGYQSQSYFGMVFRRIAGITPAECRRQARKNVYSDP